MSRFTKVFTVIKRSAQPYSPSNHQSPTRARTHPPTYLHTHLPTPVHVPVHTVTHPAATQPPTSTHLRTNSPAHPNSIFGECKNDKKYFKTLRTFGPSGLSCSALAKIQNETILYVFQEFVDMRSMYVVTLLLPSCDNILGKWTWPKIV